MILDTAQLIDDQNSTIVLPKRTNPVCILQMEDQDPFSEVLDKLRQQEKPVVILLPTSGDAFSQPKHFIDQRHLLTKGEHPPFLCLVIPFQRTSEATLAGI